jgi:hypothetical protein
MKLFYSHVFLFLFKLTWSQQENYREKISNTNFNNFSTEQQTSNDSFQLNLVCNNQTHINNSNVSLSNIEIPAFTIKIALLIYAVAFVIGIFGNGLVVIVAFLNKTQHHNFGTTNYCLVNLSVADLLFILVCLPSAILDLFSQEVW